MPRKPRLPSFGPFHRQSRRELNGSSDGLATNSQADACVAETRPTAGRDWRNERSRLVRAPTSEARSTGSDYFGSSTGKAAVGEPLRTFGVKDARARNASPIKAIQALAQIPTPSFDTLPTAAISGAPIANAVKLRPMTSAAVGRSYPSSSRMCGGTRVTNAPRMKYKLKIDAYPAAGDGPRAYAARRRHGIGFGIACAGSRTKTANKKPRSSPPDKT